MVLLGAPANDNDRGPTEFVWRDGARLYRIRTGERILVVGTDRILVTHPSRRPRVHCAHTGAFPGEVRA